jgi:hypothetical protein
MTSRSWRRALRRKSIILLFVIVALTLTAQSNNAQKAKLDPDLGDRITGGLVQDGKLWLRGTTGKESSGALIAFDLNGLSRTPYFRTGVVDIRSNDRELWVLRETPSGRSRFVLSVWRGGHFIDQAEFAATQEDTPIALLMDKGTVTVLSRKNIRSLRGDGTWGILDLRGTLHGGVQTAIASPLSGEDAYVGANQGEWGGGLQRVNLSTGEVTDVERRDKKDLCSGPLNRECDPVTGVVPDSANKDCVLASIGLVHMFSSQGRILRVCGRDVQIVFEKKVERPERWAGREMTESFYGLTRANDGFWAITTSALYHFDPNGANPQRFTLPPLKNEAGLYLSRELPGVIVLRTDVNWAVSTSGYTPLLIAND